MATRNADIGREERERVEPALKRRLESILEQAPSDASARFVLRKVRGGYMGLLKVASLQGGFTARAVGERLSDAIDGAFRDLRSQLERWRRRRTI